MEKVMKTMTANEKLVLGLLPVGAWKAQPIANIAKKTGLSHRVVKGIVRQLVIKYEIPIIGARKGAKGYYIPATEQEQLDGIKPLESQARREMERVYKLKRGTIDNYKAYMEG